MTSNTQGDAMAIRLNRVQGNTQGDAMAISLNRVQGNTQGDAMAISLNRVQGNTSSIILMFLAEGLFPGSNPIVLINKVHMCTISLIFHPMHLSNYDYYLICFLAKY